MAAPGRPRGQDEEARRLREQLQQEELAWRAEQKRAVEDAVTQARRSR